MTKKKDVHEYKKPELTPEEEKWGVILEEYLVEMDAEGNPIKVRVIEYRDSWWLDIRRMYRRKDGSLVYGKGLRICMDDGELEDVLILLQSIVGRIEFEE